MTTANNPAPSTTPPSPSEDPSRVDPLDNVRSVVVDEASLADTFKRDILEGLSRTPKRTHPKHLYDTRGSELFEGITRAEDYYPTRTEARIFAAHLHEMAEAIGPNAVIIEPGSGSGEKAERKLAALVEPKAFVPIEISMSALLDSAERIADRFPALEIHPVRADFTESDHVPDHVPGGDGAPERRCVFFPGSTIGNLEPDARAAVLRSFRRVAGEGGLLLIGTDLIKDIDTLKRAYDDSEGVTRAFNLNLLDRINRELAGDFDTSAFTHESRWNEELMRIEMHLVTLKDQDATVDGKRFDFAKDETIHTESSHKFTPEGVNAEAAEAGFEPVDAWTDERDWFRVALYRGV